MAKISGACFCGAVTYEVDGALRAARSCHCSMCRRVFGGAASAYAQVDGSFRWTAGEAQLTLYKSKQGAGFRFCATCGSSLVVTSSSSLAASNTNLRRASRRT